MNKFKKDCLAAFVLLAMFFFIGAVVLPVALDKEIARLDAVAEYNAKVYGAGAP